MLRVAIVGCGRISKRHAELLGKNNITGAKLAAVCDIKEDRATSLGKEYSVPSYQDMHEMMKSEKPDIVSVLTESGLHAKHVIALSQYGADIIVEKPMALTLQDADEMIEACEKGGVRLFVVKQNRFNVPVLALRRALEADRFGRLILGTVRVRWCRPQAYYDQDEWRGTWEYDGGVLTNQASHHIDLLEWIMGSVESVFAKSTRAMADIEAEDTAVVTLKFSNGALGLIEATTATRPKDLEGSISILGQKGTVEIGGFAVNKMLHWQFTDALPEDEDIAEKNSVNPPDVYGFGHASYYDHVVDCIVNNKQALVDGAEGRRSLELINAIYSSIETNKEISLTNYENHSQLGKKA